MKMNNGLTTLVIMLCFMLTQGCNYRTDTRDGKLLTQYSGVELFKAIYFLQGDAASKIQSLKANMENYKIAAQSNKNLGKLKEDFTSDIVSEINHLDPDYFENFKEDISSKDFFTIETALINGAKMVKAAGYRSKYAPLFVLSEESNVKKVISNEKELGNQLVTENSELQKLQQYFKEKYSLNIDGASFGIGSFTGIVVTPPTYPTLSIVPAVDFPVFIALAEVRGVNMLELANYKKPDELVHELSILI